MIELHDVLSVDRTFANQQDDSVKTVMLHLSQVIANTIDNSEMRETLLEAFLTREKLGSTGIGNGIAIPHIRTELTTKAIGSFIHLEKGIDFSSPDGQPVDLVFGFIVPEEETQEHLKLLSVLAEKLSNKAFREKLRQAQDHRQLYLLLTET